MRSARTAASEDFWAQVTEADGRLGWQRPTVYRGAPVAEIASWLRAHIHSHALAPGTVLPSARELARRFGVMPKTIRKVTGRLRDEGLIVRGTPGMGAGGRLCVAGPSDEYTCGECGIISTRRLECCGQRMGVLAQAA
jgi:Bacterial regulatory proteins, gntR family